jgi:ribosomal protein S18 acetylase RimI-like enzyme
MVARYRLGAEVDGGETAETPDGLLYAMRTEFPVMMNGALPVPGGDPARLASAAREFFGERGRGFTLFARSEGEDEAAAGAGMHAVIDRYPAMVLREPVPEVGLQPVADGAGPRAVSDLTGARDYLRVADASFVSIGMPAGVLADMRADAFFGRSDTAAFVAYAGGEPVAAASVVLAREIGGIQWVGVVERARGRGLARQVTAAAANAGFAMGAECAWLEASDMGEPVYARMGFEVVFSYRLWVASPPEA